MKTFQEFILEATNKYGIPDDEYKQWQQDRAMGKGPARKTFDGVSYEMRNKARSGQPSVWAISPVSDRIASYNKRKKAEQETQLSKDELLRATDGDEERAALALDAEESGIKRLTKRIKRMPKSPGVRKSLGHGVALQPKKPSSTDPGHTLSNLRAQDYQPNVSQQNKELKPGEPGYGLTRAQAAQDAVSRGDKLDKRIDRLLGTVRSGEPSKEANLYARLRRPKPKFKNSSQRATEQEARMTAAYDKRVDNTLKA